MKSKEHSNLTLQRALEILFHETKRSGKRQELMDKVGDKMYDNLCVLGFIADGATIDPKTKKRVRVWAVTNKPNLFHDIEREQSKREIQFFNKYIEFPE